MLKLAPESSLLLVVDVQNEFLKVIHEGDRVIQRTRFLAECAAQLGVPVVATEQNPDRLGKLDPQILSFCQDVRAKMAFSAVEPFGDNYFGSAVVVVGVEAHICIAQTVRDLRSAGVPVVVAADAVSARTVEMTNNGLARARDFGAEISHSESVVYEWMSTAAHPKFRDVLSVVKRFPSS
jgi:nicotinamidase-related amidase